jgi:hypothetical protein
VPASLPPVSSRRLPAPVRRLVGRVRSAVQDALDLPSRTELRQVMSHLEAVSRRLDDVDRSNTTPSSAPKPTSKADPVAADGASLEDERRKLKKLRKELKRELKTVAGKRSKKRKKTKTTINVGSPKSMKDRAKKKSKKD